MWGCFPKIEWAPAYVGTAIAAWVESGVAITATWWRTRSAAISGWTPEQAFAVVELLDDLRDRIWAHYGVQLLDQYRDQYGLADSDHTDNTTDNPSL